MNPWIAPGMRNHAGEALELLLPAPARVDDGLRLAPTGCAAGPAYSMCQIATSRQLDVPSCFSS
jgi:hypothetical protein